MTRPRAFLAGHAAVPLRILLLAAGGAALLFRPG
jgi:hypothetical protein